MLNEQEASRLSSMIKEKRQRAENEPSPSLLVAASVLKEFAHAAEKGEWKELPSPGELGEAIARILVNNGKDDDENKQELLDGLEKGGM